jgi:AraC family transcriptional regulator of adaptative response/methylated-DNA-[protein]-cysteine methyltransferase
MLVAAGERGVCHLRFGDDPAALEGPFRAVFPDARRAELGGDPLLGWTATLVDRLEAWGGHGAPPDIPLELRSGSAFQRRVWTHLQTIPSGETNSYQQVARAVGSPRGARAVANACARNPVALLIPCHRVVPASGEPGGYRWGSERKTVLLEAESAGRSRAAERPQRTLRGTNAIA